MEPTYFLRNGKIQSKTINPIDWEEWFDLLDLHLKIRFFASGNRIPLLPAQLTLLDSELGERQLSTPYNLKLPAFQNSLTVLLNKNRNFKGCLLTLFIHPGKDDQIPPDSIHWLVFCKELPNDYFPLNSKGLFLTIGNTETLEVRSGSSQNREILVNARGQVSEKDPGNIIVIKKDNLYFGPINQNRRSTAMVHLIKTLAPKMKLRSDNSLYAEMDLLNADEIWWVDDISGIQWIMAYKDKRYYRTTAQKMADELNNWIRSGDQFHIGSSG